MFKIGKFKINRDNNINVSKNQLVKFIVGFSNQNEYFKFLKFFSDIFEIPVKSLKNQTKIILFRNFRNRYGKFNNSFKLVKIFYNFFKFMLTFIYLKLNISNSRVKRKNYFLIVDDIDKTTNINKFKSISKKLKTAFITNYNLYNKNAYNLNSYRNLTLKKNEQINLSFIVFLKLFLFTIFYSIKLRTNIFPFMEEFYKCYFKYSSIFNQIKANFLLQDRHFNTNEIKNFLFKKKGGKFTTVTQRNILQLNGIGMFIYCDILFSLGKKSADNLKSLGGNVRYIKPVGSLAMEYNLYKSKQTNFNKIKKYDLIVFCSDHLSDFHSGYNSYYKDYYEHYSWIAKLAQKYPRMNIGLKMKRFTKDKKVIKIFKDLRNITFLYFKNISFSNSYIYAHKAKSLCTWSSTLAYEFFGEKRESFFLDPGYRNIGFLPNKKFIKKYKIKNYKTFEKTILQKINSKNRIIVKNSEFFCLNSKKTSLRIIKEFTKLLKIKSFNKFIS